jgi:hypothetical protein
MVRYLTVNAYILTFFTPFLLGAAFLSFATAQVAGTPSTMPTDEQCVASLPEGAVIVNTCPANTRMCPDHLKYHAPLCIGQTPEEKATAEREAALAASRKAADDIIAQDRQRDIDAEVARLGAQRKAEAIKAVEMRRQSDEARGVAEKADELARRLANMKPDERAAYERCREMARNGRVTCQ